MEIPKDVKSLTLHSSIVWQDEEGILHIVPRPGVVPDLSRKVFKETMDQLRAFIGDRKVCIITHSNPRSKPPSREERDYVAEEVNSITKAMAIVTTSPMSRMIANLFFGLKPPPYPAKMFTNEKDAKEWIRQYL